MNATVNWSTIPLPERMATLKKDRRGYPVPFIVARDPDGLPHFSMNNPRRVETCFKEDRCAICGTKHFRGRWFVGGPMSAFHEHGWYLDPPLHKDCMTYAMQVCPFLGAPTYSTRIDDRTVDYKKHPNLITYEPPNVVAERPKLFVAVMGVGNEYESNGVMTVARPLKRQVKNIEYWLKGQRLSPEEGKAMSASVMEEQSTASR